MLHVNIICYIFVLCCCTLCYVYQRLFDRWWYVWNTTDCIEGYVINTNDNGLIVAAQRIGKVMASIVAATAHIHTSLTQSLFSLSHTGIIYIRVSYSVRGSCGTWLWCVEWWRATRLLWTWHSMCRSCCGQHTHSIYVLFHKHFRWVKLT